MGNNSQRRIINNYQGLGGAVGELDQETVRDFYEKVEEIWPEDDPWHLYSKSQIEKNLRAHYFPTDAYVLNAGSGGSDYGLSCKMHHVDLAENKIMKHENYTVASISQLPFSDEQFTDIICVGSVLNYCGAVEALAELTRVLRPSGFLLLEYESSCGFGYMGQEAYYKQHAVLATVDYRRERHMQWLYSPCYINGVLGSIGLKIIKSIGFHYFSGLYLKITGNEQKATKFAKFDNIARRLPFIHMHAHNMFLVCQK